MLRILLTSDHLSCGEEEVWEGLTVWVGDNKRDLTITLPYNWAYMSNLVVGTDIFLCGGHMDRDTGEWSTNVLMKYDISDNQCSMVRSVHKARSTAGAAILRGNIYVVGGFDGVFPTNTAEVFCSGTGKWTLISSMRVARSGVKVVAMNSKLGGFAPQLYTLHHTGTPELELGDWKRTEGERLNK